MTSQRTRSLIALATGWNALVALWLALRLAQHAETTHLTSELLIVSAGFGVACIWQISRMQTGRGTVVLMLTSVLAIATSAGALDHFEGLIHRWQCLHGSTAAACLRAADYHGEKPGAFHEAEEARFLELACTFGQTWRACAQIEGWSTNAACEAAERACVSGDDDACEHSNSSCASTLESRCRDGDREACYDAARALETRDRELALSLDAKACRLAHDASELDGCFELADSGRADLREDACRRIVHACLFRPNRACEVYVERCETFDASPFDAR